MKKSFAYLLIFFMSIFRTQAQENEDESMKNTWFIGLEIGGNIIDGIYTNNKKDFPTSFYGGALIEYYISNQFSLIGGVKYFKTGTSFYREEIEPSSRFFCFPSCSSPGRDEYKGWYKGEVISFPITLKWYYRIFQNIYGNIALGLSLNYETKSEYKEYSQNLKTDYSSVFGGLNNSFGIDYKINTKIRLFSNIGIFIGPEKGKIDNEIIRLRNIFFTSGLKYRIN